MYGTYCKTGLTWHLGRLKGTFQQGKTPVLLEDIEDIIDCMAKLDVLNFNYCVR